MTFEPPDLIERAAEAERWDERDRAHVARIVREAFGHSFGVKTIQQTSAGLIAYDADFVSFASQPFRGGAEQPVLRCLEDLSRQLLNMKHNRL